MRESDFAPSPPPAPDYLLEGSHRHPQKLLGETAVQGTENDLLSFGLSESFNDCSIAAATACHEADKSINLANTTEDLVFLGEDGQHANMRLLELGPRMILGSRRRMQFAIGQKETEPDAPVYVFAITRKNVALRLASFGRRESSVMCDYIQIGHEMDDKNFVVTFEDEDTSRLDVVESIKDLVELHPVDIQNKLFLNSATSLRKKISESGGLHTRYLSVYYMLAEISKRGIIDDPKLLAMWQHRVSSIDAHRWNRDERYPKSIKELVDAELQDTRPIDSFVSGTRYPNKPTIGLGLDDAKWLHQVVQEYKNQPRDLNVIKRLIKLFDIDTRLKQQLGKTSDNFEKLFAAPQLSNFADTGPLRGIRRDVKIGNIVDDGEFELTVESIGKSGYRVVINGRPVSMSDKPFVHMDTIDFYCDRQPTKTALNSAKDVLDLLKYVART